MQNVSKLMVIVNVFGYHLQFIPNDTATILWNADFLRADAYEQFSVGERERGDDEIFFSAKRTPFTAVQQNHSIEFDVKFELYITYLEIMVNVCCTRLCVHWNVSSTFCINHSTMYVLFFSVSLYLYLLRAR